jgi:hypothetical protein
LRLAVAVVPGGALVNRTSAILAGLGDSVVLRHVWRDVQSTKIGYVTGGAIGLVLASRDPMAVYLAFGF